uniref:Thylakoid lumenal 17.4 kDa proteinic isoform X1 n=1 Tax=Rhizophora mucronata TaxID=61149 RepID=A0A2P2LTJ9_RHIMU
MATVSLSFSQTSYSLRCSSTRRRRFPVPGVHLPVKFICSASCKNSRDGYNSRESMFQSKELNGVACGILAAWAVTIASPVFAASQRLPPLSTEPNRCERAFVGNTIGQANGVYDKPIDLRFCDYTNDKSHLKGKSLAAALMSDAKFDGADMSEVVMSKAYAVGASFKGNLSFYHWSCLLLISHLWIYA